MDTRQFYESVPAFLHERTARLIAQTIQDYFHVETIVELIPLSVSESFRTLIGRDPRAWKVTTPPETSRELCDVIDLFVVAYGRGYEQGSSDGRVLCGSPLDALGITEGSEPMELAQHPLGVPTGDCLCRRCNGADNLRGVLVAWLRARTDRTLVNAHDIADSIENRDPEQGEWKWNPVGGWEKTG
jgi:hypothetical protein